jgi:hypothetical protein
MAQSLSPPGERRGREIAKVAMAQTLEIRLYFVLDVAQRMELLATGKSRFARWDTLEIAMV